MNYLNDPTKDMSNQFIYNLSMFMLNVSNLSTNNFVRYDVSRKDYKGFSNTSLLKGNQNRHVNKNNIRSGHVREFNGFRNRAFRNRAAKL